VRIIKLFYAIPFNIHTYSHCLLHCYYCDDLLAHKVIVGFIKAMEFDAKVATLQSYTVDDLLGCQQPVLLRVEELEEVADAGREVLAVLEVGELLENRVLHRSGWGLGVGCWGWGLDVRVGLDARIRVRARAHTYIPAQFRRSGIARLPKPKPRTPKR